jgi:hypothetical protein
MLCHPSNVHWEVDEADPRKKKHHQKGDEDVLKKKWMASIPEGTPKNLIVRTHPSRCPDANAGSGGLLSQKLRARRRWDEGSTWMQLDRRKFST